MIVTNLAQVINEFNKKFKISKLATSEISLTSNVSANAEETIAHGLSRVPTGYIVVSQNKAASLYKGTTAWTRENIYLKSSVASTAWKILVY